MSRRPPPQRSGGQALGDVPHPWYERFEAQYDALLRQQHGHAREPQPKAAVQAAARLAAALTPSRPAPDPHRARPRSPQSSQKRRHRDEQRRQVTHPADNRQAPSSSPSPRAPPATDARSSPSIRPSAEPLLSAWATPVARRDGAAGSRSSLDTDTTVQIPAGLRQLLQGEAEQRQRVARFRQQRTQDKAARGEAERRRREEHRAKMRAIQQRSALTTRPTAAALSSRGHPPAAAEQRQPTSQPPPAHDHFLADAVHIDSRPSRQGSSGGSVPIVSPPRRRRPLSHLLPSPLAPSSNASTLLACLTPAHSEQSVSTPGSGLQQSTPRGRPLKAGARGELRRVMEEMRSRRGAGEEVGVEVLLPKGVAYRKAPAHERQQRSSHGSSPAKPASATGSGEFAVVFASASSSHSASPRASW